MDMAIRAMASSGSRAPFGPTLGLVLKYARVVQLAEGLNLHEGLELLVGVLQIEADDRRHAGPHEIDVPSLVACVRPSVLVAGPPILHGDGLNLLPR